MEETIFKIRQEFRKEHSIQEGDTVIFVSPGNTKKEIKDNLKVARKGIAHFLNKFAYGVLKRENFTVFVSLPEKNFYYEKKLEKFKKYNIKVIPVYGNDNGIRYKAMASSDFGAVQSGDAVLECASF